MASKTAGAAKLLLRLPKPLYRRLKQRAKRNNVSVNTEIVNQLEGFEARLEGEAAERTKAAVRQAIDEQALEEALGDYSIPLTEIGLFTPEYARTRAKGGHPPLSPEIARTLYRASRAAGLTPTEYWRRKLKEHGIDPDAPYEAPAVATTGGTDDERMP